MYCASKSRRPARRRMGGVRRTRRKVDGCLPGTLVPGRPDDLGASRAALGERAPLRRELRPPRRHRAELPARVCQVPDLLDFAQRLLVVSSSAAAKMGRCASRRRVRTPRATTPSGTARTAETAITDDVSKTDVSCRADSALSCAHSCRSFPAKEDWRLQAARFLANGLPFLSKARHVERRGVDRCRQPRRRPLQAIQHLIDAGELTSSPAGLAL